jgi:regulator of protease activity HflC (stomatin/prohibitin superfamily)
MSDPVRPRVPISVSGVVGTLFRVLGRILKSRFFWIAVAPLLLIYCGAHWVTFYVPPNNVAIKQVFYGSNRGIQQEIYKPGVYFLMPGVEQFHLFPQDIQVMNYSNSKSEVSASERTEKAIDVKTSDGYAVAVDVSVLYRIENPYKVYTAAGAGSTYEDVIINKLTKPILLQTLGELNAEEFYSGSKRIEKIKRAQELLGALLKDQGVHLDGILVRRYVYDPKYQALIEGRKVKDQTVFWREAEAQAEIEKRKRDTIVAQGEAASKTELQRGESEVQKLHAEADLYQRKQAAQGKLLVETAEAQGTKLESEAYLNQGAENIVGIKMAEVLRGVRVLVLPSDGKEGVNPLDVGALLNKLEVK